MKQQVWQYNSAMMTAVPDQTWSHVWRTRTVLQCEMRQENQYLHEDTANLLNRHTTGLSLELTMNKPAHLLQCRPLVKCRITAADNTQQRVKLCTFPLKLNTTPDLQQYQNIENCLFTAEILTFTHITTLRNTLTDWLTLEIIISSMT